MLTSAGRRPSRLAGARFGNSDCAAAENIEVSSECRVSGIVVVKNVYRTLPSDEFRLACKDGEIMLAKNDGRR